MQSFVPLSVCLFFEAASSFTITCTHAFTVSSFQSFNPRNTRKWYYKQSTKEYRWVPNWTSPKKNFFASRTSESVIKLRNVLGKIQKITEKGFTGEILQGLYFEPPNFDWFGQICEAKNFFFWEMTSTFYNFPNCLTYQRMFWYHNPSKKEHMRKVAIFPSKTHFFFP